MKRVTNETNVEVKFNLDGTGIADSTTVISFLDHMLDHGLFDVHVRATGDIHIDDHHTNEDVALAIGTALLQALGDRKGINTCFLGGEEQYQRFRSMIIMLFIYEMDLEDLSGRPYLVANSWILLAGRNSHHIIEATFKAFARALRQATDMIHVIFGLCHGKRKEQQGRCEFVKNKLLGS
ncbi:IMIDAZOLEGLYCEROL-PHOSPHATE DEHYDRATASE HIS7 [Salix koriyanagi]|uniref:Imidazoleglycerol-phosphate dehydratase n=1 Tax=Salix koriyanagi TaxID=2511006 RepID=A0A9Q0WKJ4_9ROSI|nr:IMIDAZOLEGLYCEROL-PHOSPHATE DEHYDRATASE HIS7 [Salix koriyanagi]